MGGGFATAIGPSKHSGIRSLDCSREVINAGGNSSREAVKEDKDGGFLSALRDFVKHLATPAELGLALLSDVSSLFSFFFFFL